MREEFKNLRFSHSVALSTSRLYHGSNATKALEHLLCLPHDTQLSVAREDDAIGEYGVILTGDVIAAYDIDCLSKVDEQGNRYTTDKREQCTLEQWNNAYAYTEAFLTNWNVECIFYHQQNRKDTINSDVVELANKHGLQVMVIPCNTRKEKYYINTNSILKSYKEEKNMANTTTNTMALVNETLTKDDVMSLLNETLGRNGKIDDYLSILKGTFTAWSGEVHDGYIVCHTYKTATPETANDYMPTYVKHNDYYFMEVTLTEVDNPMKTSHLWQPTFHMLMPITENYKRKPVFHEGNTKELCQYIIDCACRDKWDYTEVPMSKKEIEEGKKRDWWWYTHHTTRLDPLTYNDIYGYWSTPLTEEEQKAKVKAEQKNEAELIARFSTGELPPAEDDAWYSVLSMGYGTSGYDLECKVLKILKNRGINAYIDGERDSFGWVTRGILIDDKVMCIY